MKEPLRVVLNLVGKIDNNRIRLKLVHYLLKEMKHVLTETQMATLLEKELALQVLNRYSQDIQRVYRGLIDHHQLIVESLIMSEQISELPKLLEDFPGLRVRFHVI